jgi:predicted anti-sigma-YlaC factor YlaD
MKDHPSQWIHSGLTCRDVAERATYYLEDRVPSLTAIRIGLHLTSCADCRSYVMQIGLVSSALRCLPKLYPSPVNRLRLSERFAGRHAN